MLLDGVKRKNTRLIEEVKDAKENNIEKRRLEIQAQKEKDDDTGEDNDDVVVQCTTVHMS